MTGVSTAIGTAKHGWIRTTWRLQPTCSTRLRKARDRDDRRRRRTSDGAQGPPRRCPRPWATSEQTVWPTATGEELMTARRLPQELRLPECRSSTGQMQDEYPV